MPAFIDVTCQGCKRRYGFAGEMKDQPPCPKCGYKPSAASLKEAEDEMAKARAEFEAEFATRASLRKEKSSHQTNQETRNS